MGWMEDAKKDLSTPAPVVDETPVVNTEEIPIQAGQVEDVKPTEQTEEPLKIDDTQLSTEEVVEEEKTVPVAEEATPDIDAIKALKQKKWAELTNEEQRSLNDYTKTEYNKYNTQTSQDNSAEKKRLEEQARRLNEEIRSFNNFQEQNARTVQQQGQEPQGEVTEIEYLNKELGLELDEFSSKNEMVMARNQLESNQRMAKNTQEKDQQYRQADIDKRYSTWKSLQAEQKLPDNEQFESGIFARVLAMKAFNPNYDIADAVADNKKSLGIDTSDNFINFVKNNEYYEAVKAAVISEIRNAQANTPIIPKPTGASIPTSSPTKYTPKGDLGKATENALRSLGIRR